MANVEAGAVTPGSCTSSQTNSDEQLEQRRIRRTEGHNRRSHATCSTSPEGIKHGKRNPNLRKPPISEESRVHSSAAGAVSEGKSRDSSKGPSNSKKQTVLRADSNRISTAL